VSKYNNFKKPSSFMLKKFYMVSCLMFSGSMVWASSTQESSQEKNIHSLTPMRYRFPTNVIQIMARYVGEALVGGKQPERVKLPPLNGSIAFSTLTWTCNLGNQSILISQWFTPENGAYDGAHTAVRQIKMEFPFTEIVSLAVLTKTEDEYGDADELNHRARAKNKTRLPFGMLEPKDDYAMPCDRSQLAIADKHNNLSIFKFPDCILSHPEEVLDEQFGLGFGESQYGLQERSKPVRPYVKHPRKGTRKEPAAKRQKALSGKAD